MKILATILGLSLVLAASGAVLAAEKEEVMMRDGTTALVEVVETTPDSVTVKFKTKTGASGQAKLRAVNMDFISFYDIRRRHMEKTVENHVRLAVFCAGWGDFNRARRQMDLARAIDPELDQKLAERPDILEKIAAKVFESVLAHEKEGNLELAHEVASRLVSLLPETKTADRARAWLKEREAEYEKNRVAEESAKEAAAEKAEAAESKADLKAQEKILKPIRTTLDRAHKMNAAGQQEKSQNKAKSAYEAAAAEYKKALGQVRKAKDRKDLPAGTGDELGRLEEQAIHECVDSYLNAANVELGRGNTSGAKKYAEKALEVDPGNKRAEEMKTRADLATTDKLYLDEIRGRRPRGGGGGGRR
jgi:tetratricopeptide (TPR) repeat protein